MVDKNQLSDRLVAIGSLPIKLQDAGRIQAGCRQDVSNESAVGVELECNKGAG